MKYTAIFFLLLVLTGCNAEQDEEILMTEKFWNSISTNDVATLKGLISESEYNSAFGKESGFSGFALVADVKVGEKLKNGNVKTIFKKFCHPEYSTETVIIQNNGKKIIDARATFFAQLKKSKDLKPLKKYCYSFNRSPMSGKISGKEVTFKFLKKEVFDFGTHKKESFELTTENCEVNNCNKSKSSKLLISNLKLNTEGGNFTYAENVTLFTATTNHNEIVTAGSYRVSPTASGKKKLEISFKLDKNNFINGYVEF